MICDIIETGVKINNGFNINIIPYSYLTRIEKEPLMALNKLDRLFIEMSNNHNKEFALLSMEDDLKLKYQTLCNAHLQKLIDHEKIGNIIYISMEHYVDSFKETHKDFYFSELYRHLHIVLELYHWDDSGIYVKNVPLNRKEFMRHQELARVKEKQYNLKHNLKEYFTCHYCLATLCSIALYYQDNMGYSPTKLSQIPSDFSNALVLLKNDRISIGNVCTVSKNKWKSPNFEQYFIKLKNICESRQWDYEKIISYIHKTHYAIMKTCEHIRDKNTFNDRWGKTRNLDSPKWRSNITVA